MADPNEPRDPSEPDRLMDVSVESVSGLYVKLAKQGKLKALKGLRDKQWHLTVDLATVDADLAKINDRFWLIDFYAGKDSDSFVSKLKARAKKLDGRKAKLSSELKAVEGQISAIDRDLLQVCPTRAIISLVASLDD
jgi:hypothetical protein